MTPAVSFRQVSRHFGAVNAVDAVDLDIRPGEFFAMLGPSGSGKTTCLRLIAGFEQPTAGHIEIFGERAEGVPPYRRNVNTVFQDYALFPHLNVLDNVAYGLMVKGVGKAERRKAAEEALALVQLPGYGARRPGQLSGGQRQRVALARALVNQPKGAAARRAARRARPQAAREHAGGAEGAAEIARHHLRLRHPRPGRGAVDGRPRRRLQRRPHHAGRHAGGDLPAPELALRRRFRRLVQRAAARFRRAPRRPAALGEPPAGDDRDRSTAGKASPASSVRASFSARPPGSPSRPRARASTSSCPPPGPLPAEGSIVALSWAPGDLHLMDEPA